MEQEKSCRQPSRLRNICEKYPWAILALYAFAVMLFCTRSSPLYIINGWPDANAYFTMGRGVLHGMVPYRDLFDHKGPLTYLFFAVGALFTQSSFFGVYLVQSLMLGITLCFAYKMLLLFSENKPVCMLLAMSLGMFLLQGSCYVDGGGSPDEFSVTFEMVSIYYFTRYFRSGESAHNPRIMFLHGVTAACVLMMKLNLVLLWLGFGAMVFLKLLVEKQFANFFKNMLFLLMGVAAVCLPYVFYALATDSLDDFIEAYFSYNLMYSDVKLSLLQKAVGTFKAICKFGIINFSIFVMSAAGIIRFLFKKNCPGGIYWKLGALFSYGLCLISIYLSKETPPYVFLPSTVFAVFGLASVAELTEKFFAKPRKPAGMPQSLFAALLVFAVTVSANGYISASRLLPAGRVQPPQRQFAEIMHERRENPTMMMYRTMDDGFYTASGIMPVNRFYYKPSGVPYEQFPYVRDEQDELLKAKKVDFVVCRTDAPENTYVKNEFLNENYELIAVSEKNLQFPIYYLLFEVKS